MQAIKEFLNFLSALLAPASHGVGFNTFLIFSATALGTMLMVVAAVFLLFHKDGKHGNALSTPALFRERLKEIFFLATSALASLALTTFIKFIVHAPRPFETGVASLFTYAGGDSFPSGHATFFASLAVSLLLLHRNIFTYIFAVLCLVVPLARVLVGIHYPIDLVAGVVIGSFFSYACWIVFGLWKNK